MIKAEDVIRIGRLGKPHGIAGELGFHFEDDVFDRTQCPYWLVMTDGILVPFFWESYRFRSETTALVKFEGVDNERQARAMSNQEVFYPKSQLDKDWYEHQPLTWTQLVGWQLTDAGSGASFGEITAVDDSTLNVLLEVRGPKGKLIVPAAEELFEVFDKGNSRLSLRVPEGLLEMY